MTTEPLLLGLTGPRGAGKDTAAAYLEDHYAFAATAFADPILDMLGALAQHVDVDGAWLVERALKEQPMPVLARSYRELARSLGQAWGRGELGPQWWVRIVHHKWTQARARGDNLVVTDVRYLNEAAWLRINGGHLVGLQRDGCAFAAHEHGSEFEAAQLQPEHVITNHSTHAHLHDQLDVLIERLRANTETRA